MRIEGKDAEHIQRTLEGAFKYGATHVGFQLSGADKTLEGESITFFTSSNGGKLYAKRQELILGANVVIAPLEKLTAEVKKQLKACTTEPGKEPPDIRINLEKVYDRPVPDKDAVHERISKNPTLLKELMEKPQVFMEKEPSPGYGKTSVLEDRINKEEIPAIKQALQAEKDSGHRFVTFPLKAELHAADFKFHRSALAALDHQYDKANRNERQEVRSIAVVEKDLDKLLGNKKEHGQDVRMENQREDKRSRGMDIER